MAKKKTTKTKKRRPAAKKSAARKKTASKQVKMCCPECKHCQMMKIAGKKCPSSFTCKECGKKNNAKKCCAICDYSKSKCPGCM